MSSSDKHDELPTFGDLNLIAPLIKALNDVGYETPTPIQRQAIPPLLEGRDLLGHAPTGTGKTAAFALPLLSRIDPKSTKVQVMALAPTRELAIQVAEAFKSYAAHMKHFQVLPIYGGQEYGGQIRALKRGVQVVVGTPGRVMDHMRKGTLQLDGLQALVLDEADEMLRMGFIEEVEWILEQTPPKRQMALFSATMPKQVERIARRYLNNPETVQIEAKTATAETIRQRFWQVSGYHKLDALTRILEVEDFDAVLIFVRTKTATVELAERLEARGYAASAMNGDMVQKQREQMVERLKKGRLDILVATDVAARGLDVERISHVINFDIPYDAEAYIHRIGRTGRAGRTGEAILFVAPRERRMLNVIERATRQRIERLELPTTETVNNKRIAGFKQRITDTLAAGELGFMQSLVEQYRQEHDVPAVDIAAALAVMTIGDQPLLLKPETDRPQQRKRDDRERPSRDDRSREPRERSGPRRDRDRRPDHDDMESELYRLEVGMTHGAQPANIVGALANEAGLDGRLINIVEMNDDHSLVALPTGMPKEIFQDLKKVYVCGQKLQITHAEGAKLAKARRGPSKSNAGKPRHKAGGRDSKPGRKPAGKKPAGKGNKKTNKRTAVKKAPPKKRK